MLKHRIIPVLLWDGFQCVKPVSFQRPYRKLGAIEQYIQVIERRNVDELIIIDIEATNEKRKPYFDKLRRYCDNLFCPVTYGGGISSLDDIRMALENGADKVAIKSKIDLIDEASKKFGAQAIVGVCDAFEFKTNFNISWAETLQQEGAGELIITDTRLDGRMDGYSLLLIERICESVSVPVIALGGCGEPEHMHQALDAGASAVAAGSMFLYTDYTPKDCAIYLEERGWPVRVNE